MVQGLRRPARDLEAHAIDGGGSGARLRQPLTGLFAPASLGGQSDGGANTCQLVTAKESGPISPDSRTRPNWLLNPTGSPTHSSILAGVTSTISQILPGVCAR